MSLLCEDATLALLASKPDGIIPLVTGDLTMIDCDQKVAAAKHKRMQSVPTKSCSENKKAETAFPSLNTDGQVIQSRD